MMSTNLAMVATAATAGAIMVAVDAHAAPLAVAITLLVAVVAVGRAIIRLVGLLAKSAAPSGKQHKEI